VQSEHDADASLPLVVPASPWARIKEHKVLQWSLAYLGAALALAHGQELLAHNFHWPELVGHVLVGALIVGFPIAVALAWYHGHRGMTRFSAPEATVVALLLVIAAVLLAALVRGPEEQAVSVSTAPAVPPTESASRVPAASVAVVPFANLTGDSSKDYFSDGMAEELIDALANVPGLKVPSRTSSFAYKGHNTDIRRIAQDLGVDKILEGSVRSAGESVRVTAQLVDARSGYHLWSQTYDRKFADIFKLQDELAKSIVEQLLGRIGTSSAEVGIKTPSTQNVEAYQLYLQARALEGIPTLQTLRRAIELLNQVLALDPGYVEAWRDRAVSRTRLVSFLGEPPDGLLQAERDALLQKTTKLKRTKIRVLMRLPIWQAYPAFTAAAPLG